ncbi:DNA-processing protein DprA [Kribbella deserti]|uniref:DNA-processing protein DprA n=1 Tax=Kribbella deserti TaxID=1926257 RepID=A0ABV6QWK5_9ACTN
MTATASDTTDTAAATDEGREAERIARAGLSRVIEPGDPAALATFDGMGPVEIWHRLQSGGPDVERWSARVAEARPEDELRHALKAHYRFVIPGDDEWPDQIEVLADAGQLSRRGGVPFGLWVRGSADLRKLLEQSIAVVGARACTPYGEHVAGELSAGLADKGMTVVSGGAYGIDAAAHRGTLAASGTTIAVLACGVNVSYPKGNHALFDRILEKGLIVSELPPGCSPTRLRFLARNRLIASLSLGTVITEAAVRSGALNTAGWAEQCGRPVLAVPGPITSAKSEGSHLLVRERNALLVTSASDILEAVAPYGSHLAEPRRGPQRPSDGLTPDELRVLDAVPVVVPATLTSISRTAGLEPQVVKIALTHLATANLVEPLADRWRLSKSHRTNQ